MFYLLNKIKKIGVEIARSAFRSIDRNHNGYLDNNDVNRAYSLMGRLYH